MPFNNVSNVRGFFPHILPGCLRFPKVTRPQSEAVPFAFFRPTLYSGGKAVRLTVKRSVPIWCYVGREFVWGGAVFVVFPRNYSMILPLKLF